jgi:hypothetical protein
VTSPLPESARGVPPAPARRTTNADDRPALPDQTGDDLDVGWGERFDDTSDDDERYLRERPPHWD